LPFLFCCLLGWKEEVNGRRRGNGEGGGERGFSYLRNKGNGMGEEDLLCSF